MTQNEVKKTREEIGKEQRCRWSKRAQEMTLEEIGQVLGNGAWSWLWEGEIRCHLTLFRVNSGYLEVKFFDNDNMGKTCRFSPSVARKFMEKTLVFCYNGKRISAGIDWANAPTHYCWNEYLIPFDISWD